MKIELDHRVQELDFCWCRGGCCLPFFFLLICIRRGLDFSGYALMDDRLIVVGTVGHSLKMLFSVFDA